MNNKNFFITHLSADKLSGLNFLSVIHLLFLSSNFAFSRPKNQNLKKNRHGADTNAYKYLLLGSRLFVILSMRPVCKIVFFRLMFSRHVAAKKCVISYVKIVNEIKCFSSRLS